MELLPDIWVYLLRTSVHPFQCMVIIGSVLLKAHFGLCCCDLEVGVFLGWFCFLLLVLWLVGGF